MNWHNYFIYSSRGIIWKERNRSEFKNKAGYMGANTLSGHLSGSLVTSKNSKTKYLQTEIHGKAYKNHRIVWEMFFGEIKNGLLIDHIDGNGLNNTIENLRLVDSVTSMHNLPIQKSNKTGYVGVCWHKSAKMWQARISFNGQRFDLGRYRDISDAVKARKIAEKDLGYHKNHGRLSK